MSQWNGDRSVFKVREVINLLRTGKPADITVCSYDENRPEKSGRKIELKQVMLTSYEGFGKANVRLQNGHIQTLHPVLIEVFNGTKVTP